MRRALSAVLTLAFTLLGAGAAQAVVVDLNPAAQGNLVHYGVALMPGGRSLASAGVSTVTTAGQCTDVPPPGGPGPGPLLPVGSLCWHGGSVMHTNETFGLTWDPNRSYWETTKNYVQQFLRDVADGSGTLTSPFAVTTQYGDSSGRAANVSKYGGSCVDYGSGSTSTCQLGDTVGSGRGNPYPNGGRGDCSVSGTSQPGGTTNTVCLTDRAIQDEVRAMVPSTNVDTLHQSGPTPLMVVLTPPGVEVCLDGAGKLCSANSDPAAVPAHFCSYHSQVTVNRIQVAYVVQPWTTLTRCDEPDAQPIPPYPTPQEFATDVGIRLVSPLSQAMIGSIVNPWLNGWFAGDGSEINDNGCVPGNHNLDSATVGAGSQNPYLLQREFNNTGLIQHDPNSPICAPGVVLSPQFVVPSAVNQGDVVQLDGSTTASSLIVPNAEYQWNYGDGSPAGVGPSVEHRYATAGTYTVTLTVTDRGGNKATLAQTITVLDANGQPATPPTMQPPTMEPPTMQPPTSTSSTTPTLSPVPPATLAPPAAPAIPPLRLHLQLMPQGIRAMLAHGIDIAVSANQPANGIAYITISRALARRAGIKTGNRQSVRIGVGTVTGVKPGTVDLHLRLAKGVAAKLGHLHRLTLAVRLALVGAGGSRAAVDVAGRY